MANGKLDTCTERRLVSVVEPSRSENVSDKLSFVSFIIPKFASGYKMGIQEAYFYLKKYGGLDFLYECWWALHTDNPVWAIRDMAQVCRNNGGYLK